VLRQPGARPLGRTPPESELSAVRRAHPTHAAHMAKLPRVRAHVRRVKARILHLVAAKRPARTGIPRLVRSVTSRGRGSCAPPLRRRKRRGGAQRQVLAKRLGAAVLAIVHGRRRSRRNPPSGIGHHPPARKAGFCSVLMAADPVRERAAPPPPHARAAPVWPCLGRLIGVGSPGRGGPAGTPEAAALLSLLAHRLQPLLRQDPQDVIHASLQLRQPFVDLVDAPIQARHLAVHFVFSLAPSRP